MKITYVNCGLINACKSQSMTQCLIMVRKILAKVHDLTQFRFDSQKVRPVQINTEYFLLQNLSTSE